MLLGKQSRKTKLPNLFKNAKPTLDFGLGWVYFIREGDGGEGNKT